MTHRVSINRSSNVPSHVRGCTHGSKQSLKPEFSDLIGYHLKPSHLSLPNSLSFSFGTIHHRKSVISVNKWQVSAQASYRDERANSAGVFIGGFVLGGLIVGTLGCVFAPEISKVITGADRKDLMRKLPKFIYDEEKALEWTWLYASYVKELVTDDRVTVATLVDLTLNLF
ncbi:uncharacterized protein LOC110035527 [Phalaenopsis equestris]|uniref:uncharacterized protein LOC110035527 n=1 Tax=Phalaenopsis equestris TaxID=78828 RepID=UPI0009E47EEC|nr:uncharacterized protein LOC110035527 [Phalaenopsis equestris]